MSYAAAGVSDSAGYSNGVKSSMDRAPMSGAMLGTPSATGNLVGKHRQGRRKVLPRRFPRPRVLELDTVSSSARRRRGRADDPCSAPHAHERSSGLRSSEMATSLRGGSGRIVQTPLRERAAPASMPEPVSPPTPLRGRPSAPGGGRRSGSAAPLPVREDC